MCPGLTFRGLRHSHNSWMIDDDVPEIVRSRRLGHHLDNRLVETYSHVSGDVQRRLLTKLEQRWHAATRATATPTPVTPRSGQPSSNLATGAPTQHARRSTTTPDTTPTQRARLRTGDPVWAHRKAPDVNSPHSTRNDNHRDSGGANNSYSIGIRMADRITPIDDHAISLDRPEEHTLASIN